MIGFLGGGVVRWLLEPGRDMNKLESELRRLYCLPGQTIASFDSDQGAGVIELLSTGGLLRCFVISVEKGCDWTSVAAFYQGLQEDLDLPAPALAVSVEDGYQIWFSLAEPIPLQLAHDFMDALSRRYLAGIKAAKLRFRPDRAGELRSLPVVPAKQANLERWSAFIDPTMGSMFVEESWLEMAPSLDKQAAMLVGLESITAPDLQKALGLLQSLPDASGVLPPEIGVDSGQIERPSGAASLGAGNHFTHPRDFLLAVMNDPSASTDQRIAAAIALLPFCKKE